MEIKIALPKGRLLGETDALLDNAGWGLDGYDKDARMYRLKSIKYPGLAAKIFHEKDVPIQVAIGNYDFGICGLDWVEELLAKNPSSALVKVKSLGYGEGSLYLAASKYGEVLTTDELRWKPGVIRIASEYPNLAESLALKLRIRRFSIFPVWGAAEVYPPESTDIVLIPVNSDGELSGYGLVPFNKVLDFSAYLIANKDSWETKDMVSLLNTVKGKNEVRTAPLKIDIEQAAVKERPQINVTGDAVRLALPDGHQQVHVREILKKAVIRVDDYPSATGNRRPTTDVPGVMIKVIRPQDMPMQVANGNFDLAISGRDWLRDHIYRFPSSPVKEILDLKYGKVRVVAVVSNEVSAGDILGMRKLISDCKAPFRIASEYVNIADKYARDNHFGLYRIIPTWGATEAFIPEDADLLIENTETGGTIDRHNLKIIDTLFESTACLIGNIDSLYNPKKLKSIESITDKLRAAVEKY